MAAFAGIPLIVGNDLVGILGLFSETAFTQKRLAVALTSVADQIALCIVRKQAENALKKSEATLKSIFRAAPTGIGLVRIVFCWTLTSGSAEMTGYSREELVGQSARCSIQPSRNLIGSAVKSTTGYSKFGTGTVGDPLEAERWADY